MSSSHYTHTFTWPPTPSKSVIVTGTFDDWSGTVHHLHQNKDTGYWEGKVDMPFGERVAYKYVVDGHWLIREDEAKEWDAAGNMNNIFTPPSATESHNPTHPHAQSTPTSNTLATGTTIASSPTSHTSPLPSSRQQDETRDTALPRGEDHSLSSPTGHASSRDQEEHKGIVEKTKEKASELVSAASPTSAVSPKHDEPSRESTRQVGRSSFEQNETARLVGHEQRYENNNNGGQQTGSGSGSGSDLLAGLSLGAPIGGGQSSYALPVASRETTTTTTNTNSSTTAATTYQAEQTGSTGTSDIVPSAPEASTTTASAHTHTHTHEPSEPIKELADATSTSGTSSSADRTNENVTGSHEPADPLKALAAATAPVLGASPGATNLKAEKEMNTADHTPAGPIKALADSTSPLGTSATSATTESRAREGNVGTKNVPSSTATTEEHGFAETFTHAGTSTLAALGAAASGLVMGVNEIVHNATGVDIVHRQPMSVEEAKAKGIDPVTGEPIESHSDTATYTHTTAVTVPAGEKAVPAPAEKVGSTVPSYADYTGLGAPIGGQAAGPSPTAFTAPAVNGINEPAPVPVGVSTGPAPAQVVGAGLGQSSSSQIRSLPSEVRPEPVVPKPAAHNPYAIPLPPVPATNSGIAAPQQQFPRGGSSSSDKIASNTRQATGSGPVSGKHDVFSSNDDHAKEKDSKINDIPAQHETKESNHKKVPQPMITNIGEPTKDRTQPSKTEDVGKQIGSRPDEDPKKAALEDERRRAGENIDGMPSRSYAKKPVTEGAPAGLPLGTTQKPIAMDTAPVTPTKNIVPVVGTAPSTPVQARTGDVAVPVAASPQTPASRVANRESQIQPGTPSTTASSTPGRHTKEESSDSVRKRKSSFFAKIKGALKKDKSAKA